MKILFYHFSPTQPFEAGDFSLLRYASFLFAPNRSSPNCLTFQSPNLTIYFDKYNKMID
jgi:hypothetical protein